MEQGRVQVVYRRPIFYGAVPDFVSCTIPGSPFDTPAGQPAGKRVRIVVSTWFLGFLCHWKTAKLPTPHDECCFQETALLEVCQQSSDRFVCFTSKLSVIATDVVVSVPASLIFVSTGVDLYETDTPFHHPPCQQALLGKMTTVGIIQSVLPLG